MIWLGAVTHTCNPALWETEVSGSWGQPGQHSENPSLLKIQKISWAWWRASVVPATWEAEAGELLEPRRRRLRWAEIAPLHSSLGNKSKTPSQKKRCNRSRSTCVFIPNRIHTIVAAALKYLLRSWLLQHSRSCQAYCGTLLCVC